MPSVLDLAGRRLALPENPSGSVQAERMLAAVRTLLAASSVLLAWFDPTAVGPFHQLVLILLFLYLTNAIWVLLAVERRAGISLRFSVVVHAVDILWPAVVILLVGRLASPFFLYYLFVLLAAAFRWGMRQTALTTLAIIFTIAANAMALARTPLGQMIGQSVDAPQFVMEAVYVMIFGFLIGYLAESEKRGAAEVLGILQTATKIQVDAGLLGAAEGVFQEVLRLVGARELLVIVREPEGSQPVLWRGEVEESGNVVFSWRPLDENGEQEYQFTADAEVSAAAWLKGSVVSAVTLDKDGTRLRGREARLSAEFASGHGFERLLACALAADSRMAARIFLLDPVLGGQTRTQLRFLQDLSSLLAPSLYNVFLLRRLRSRAVAAERARVARELHDGVVQSLHAIAFRLYALRTRSTLAPAERQQELLEMQQLAQNEAANVRNLIQQLEPLDFDTRQLADFLSGMVTRYRQDTGIRAQFVCDTPEVNLPPATCRELAGILREALANVRRHSGARNVMVRLQRHREGWMLTIEDDGRGFEFSGRFSHAELDQFRRGPLVIKQRVRAISGELTIISKPGQGARLEIRVPILAQASSA